MKISVELVSGKFVLDEVSYQKLFSKGFGQKIENLFELDIYEVLYLIENLKIEVFKKNKKIDFKDLVNKVDFKNYIVYKDLRSKGYRVKSGLKYGFEFRVYDKGVNINKGHSIFLVWILSENEKIKIIDFTAKNRVAHSTKKEVLIAIVDIEEGVTYFNSNWEKI